MSGVTPDKVAMLLRVRHAVDAAYSEGVSAEEIQRAVVDGIDHAKYVIELFAPSTTSHELRRVA